jgi:hypothetical protein
MKPEPLGAARGGQGGPEIGGPLRVRALASVPQGRRDGRPVRFGKAVGDHAALDRLRGLVGREPEGAAEAAGEGLRSVRTHVLARRRLDRLPQSVACRLGADHAPCFREIGAGPARGVGENAVDRAVQKLARLVSSRTAKPGGTLASKGNELQQPLAEGVQRLDLQTARRFYGAGEQAAGEPDVLGAGLLAF